MLSVIVALYKPCKPKPKPNPFEDDKDSIVLVTETQIPVNLKYVLAGLTVYFG